MEWYDYLRIVTTTLSGIALLVICYRAVHNWSLYTEYLKDLFIVLVACLGFIMEASIEQIARDRPIGPQTLLAFCIAAFAFSATAKKGGFIRNDPITKALAPYKVKHRKEKRHGYHQS